MASHLLIVESPSKAKTLKKYLGKDYEILASYGHVRDLVPKTGAADPDDGRRTKYEVIERSALALNQSVGLKPIAEPLRMLTRTKSKIWSSVRAQLR